METKDIIIFLSGFVSAMVLNFISHVFQSIRDKKNRFLNISNDLVKPFIEARTIFDKSTRGLHEGTRVQDTFIRLYSDQRINIQSIIPHIPKRQRSRLQAAWDKYEKQINNDSPSSFFANDNTYKKLEGIAEKREVLTSMIDDIVFFFDYHNMFSIFK